jgi:hypothetical protein
METFCRGADRLRAVVPRARWPLAPFGRGGISHAPLSKNLSLHASRGGPFHLDPRLGGMSKSGPPASASRTAPTNLPLRSEQNSVTALKLQNPILSSEFNNIVDGSSFNMDIGEAMKSDRNLQNGCDDLQTMSAGGTKKWKPRARTGQSCRPLIQLKVRKKFLRTQSKSFLHFPNTDSTGKTDSHR